MAGDVMMAAQPFGAIRYLNPRLGARAKRLQSVLTDNLGRLFFKFALTVNQRNVHCAVGHPN